MDYLAITRVIIGAVLNGLIAYVGAMLTLLTSLDSGVSLDAIGDVPRYVAAVTGLMTGLKDVQSALKTHNFRIQPP
jgi:hypothetical protein